MKLTAEELAQFNLDAKAVQGYIAEAIDRKPSDRLCFTPPGSAASRIRNLALRLLKTEIRVS